jgi:hypothetical protein
VSSETSLSDQALEEVLRIERVLQNWCLRRHDWVRRNMLDKNTEAQPNVLLGEANLRRERGKNQDWNGKVRETMMRKFLEGIVEAD